MNQPISEHLSESEEMYLVTTARIQESAGSQPVPISQLAKELEVLPVSANQMVRKLAENDLIVYTPYKGVSLTAQGARLALHILRHRRLWEVFLVERLAYTPEEAHNLACRLEHTLPAEAAERLAEFLGNPTSNPLGEPIPRNPSEKTLPAGKPLSDLYAGQAGRVASIQADMAGRSFLLAQGVAPGAAVRVLARSSSGEVLVGLGGGAAIHLADPLTRDITITISSDLSGFVFPVSSSCSKP